jgi:RimJ/RimL family protein N-acetyltransferase
MYDSFPHPYTETDAVNWIEYATSSCPVTHYAIEADGLAVGAIGFTPGKDVRRLSAEIGYWLSEKYHGRGIATSSLIALTDYIFKEHNYIRVHASVYSSNPASQRVLEKSGYILESVHKNAIFKCGTIMDELVYARLRK